MNKKPRITPELLSKFNINLDDAYLELISSEEWQEQFLKSEAYKKYIQPIYEEEKSKKKQCRKDWWKNNWISFLSLVFAFIAAIPVIIQAVEYILSSTM